MIIEWRKGGKSLFGADKSALQKAEGAFCFYIIATEIVKFRSRNLLANQRFAVEILKFRLSIVVIEESGKTLRTRILSDEEYLAMLDLKLDEELAEYHKDQNIEELADMLELIRAAAIARGYTLEELEAARAEKAKKRGGFEKKIFLIDVSDADN
jgi:predicted house-cleaning noncanonical NTP pyrophosphatase (MazG superfamily)